MLTVILAVVVTAVFSPTTMASNCNGSALRDLRDATKTADKLERGGFTADAVSIRALVADSNGRACSYSRFVRASASAAWRAAEMSASSGDAVRFENMVIRRVDDVWQIDWLATAKYMNHRSRKANARRFQNTYLHMVPVTRGKIIWTGNPLAADYEVNHQLSMAMQARRLRFRSVLNKSLKPILETLNSRNAMSMTVFQHAKLAATTGILTMSTGSRMQMRSAKRAMEKSYARLRALDAKTWTRNSDGGWSTLSEHKKLAKAAVSLEESYRKLGKRSSRNNLGSRWKRMMQTEPGIRYLRAGNQEFIPWPNDGHKDNVWVSVGVNKPGIATLVIHDTEGKIVWKTFESVAPGHWNPSWNGLRMDGSRSPAGNYRYRVRVVDFAGNSTTLPGLGEIELVRDTVPPQIEVAKVQAVTSAASGDRKSALRVTWRVVEQLSPKVTVNIKIRGPGGRKLIRVASGELAGGKVFEPGLTPGRYRITLTMIDGSGNRESRYFPGIAIE